VGSFFAIYQERAGVTISSDILIIREGDNYRVLHGYLRLVNELHLYGEIEVDVIGEGKIKIVRTRHGYFAGFENLQLPVLTG
jgi:predicted nucleotidyltransferase